MMPLSDDLLLSPAMKFSIIVSSHETGACFSVNLLSKKNLSTASLHKLPFHWQFDEQAGC